MDIQRELIRLKFLPAGSDDGGYGPATSQAVASWQFTRWLDADGIFGSTSQGMMFPPQGAVFGVDFSWFQPNGKFLANRGVNFVGNYLWKAEGNKGISRAEYDDFKANNIDVFFFYETYSEDSMALGYDKGVEHAKSAQRFLDELGLPDAVVHFNVDHDAVLSQREAILDGCRGAASVIGLDRVGLYGEYDVIKWAFDANVISYACQTYAWSNGKWDPRATTRQWSNGQWADQVDFQWAMTKDFGQK